MQLVSIRSHICEFRKFILLLLAGKLLDAGTTVIVLTLDETAREAVPFTRYLIVQLGLVPAATVATVLSLLAGIAFCYATDGMVSLYERTRRHRSQVVRVAYVLLTTALFSVAVHNALQL